VVLIEETLPFRSNLPVQARNVKAVPIEAPVIDSVSPQAVSAGDILTIVGSNFIGDSPEDTLVSFDGGAPVVPDTLQGGTIRIAIPATLQPGVRGVRVVRNIRFGTSAQTRTGSSSDSALYQLRPTITDVSPLAASVGKPLAIHVEPNVGRAQRAALFIGDYSVISDPLPPTAPDTSDTLTFNLPAAFPYTTPATGLPLRVQVDGVDSALALDQNSSSATYGKFLPQAVVSGP